MRTLTGKVENVQYFDTSTMGNSRYTANIGGVYVFTGVNSSLGSAIKNYEGKCIKCEARIIRGKLVIDSRIEVLPDNGPDKPTCDYRARELSAVRTDADKHYMPSIMARSDSGQTKHLAISWEEFERIAALLTGED